MSEQALAPDKLMEWIQSGVAYDRPIVFVDEDRRPRMILGLVPDTGPLISFLSKAGRPKAGLVLKDPTGDAELTFSDESGRPQMSVGVIGASAGGGVQVSVDGQLRLMVSLDADGTPRILLLDANEKPRLVAKLEADGTPRLRFYGSDSTLTWATPGDPGPSRPASGGRLDAGA